MIYYTRNQRNDKTKSQKEKKIYFSTHFQHSQLKIMVQE